MPRSPRRSAAPRLARYRPRARNRRTAARDRRPSAAIEHRRVRATSTPRHDPASAASVIGITSFHSVRRDGSALLLRVEHPSPRGSPPRAGPDPPVGRNPAAGCNADYPDRDHRRSAPPGRRHERSTEGVTATRSPQPLPGSVRGGADALEGRVGAASADERALVRRLRSGDEAAFAALVGRHHPAMVRLALGYVRSRAVAEEVAQEAWLGMLRGLDGFEGRASLRTWLFQIVVNRAISAGRREHRYVPVDDRDLEDDDGAFGQDGWWTTPPVHWADR